MQLLITGYPLYTYGKGIKDRKIQRVIKKIIKSTLMQDGVEILFVRIGVAIDHWAAEIAIKLKIPFVAVVPFKNLTDKWSISSKNKCNFLLKRACKVVYTDRELHYIYGNPDIFCTQKFTNRDYWIQDQLEPNNSFCLTFRRTRAITVKQHTVFDTFRLFKKGIDSCIFDPINSTCKLRKVSDGDDILFQLFKPQTSTIDKFHRMMMMGDTIISAMKLDKEILEFDEEDDIPF